MVVEADKGRRFNETGLVIVSIAMGIIFCLLVFFYLQPIINEWIVGALHPATDKKMVEGNNNIYYLLGAIVFGLFVKKTASKKSE